MKLPPTQDTQEGLTLTTSLSHKTHTEDYLYNEHSLED